MRAKGILFISLAANVALTAAVVVLCRYAEMNARQPESNGPVIVSKAPSVRVAKTNVFLRSKIFNWQDIESTNYDLYVMNLRGIGCPESTVRDIILADVNQMYARKRREVNLTTNDMQWWRSEPDPEEMRAALKRAQAVDAEQKKLLARLLGPKWDEVPSLPAEPVLLNGPALSALTPEQKQTVQDIVERSRQTVRDYVKGREQAGEIPDQAELAQLREATRRELEQKLSPQQLEEFLLRYSNNASQLREQLRGFNTSPEEFRQLFAVTDRFDRELQLLPEEDDPAVATRRRELEQQRDAAIQQTLSPERFDAYRMARDPDYRLAMTEAQEAGGAANVGRALYELNRASALERERIRQDSSLTPEQREQQLRDMEYERLVARAQALGQEPPPDTRPKPATPPHWQHSAVPGETLASLAMRYRVPLNELVRANPGIGYDLLQPGQAVRIPPSGPPMPPVITPTRVPPFGRAGEGASPGPGVPLTPTRVPPFGRAGEPPRR